MGIIDLLDDYHPESLTMDEVWDMVEGAKYGTSACDVIPVCRNDDEFIECVRENGWLVYAMDIKPNRKEIKVMDLDGNVRWIDITDNWSHPGRHKLMVLPPSLSMAPVREIIDRAISYFNIRYDTVYKVTGINFPDIHEYLHPVCELSSEYSAAVVYDETTGTFHHGFKLGQICAASYASYVLKAHGVDVSQPPGKLKPNSVDSRAKELLTEQQMAEKVFHQIVSMSYNRIRSAQAKNQMTLDATGLVRMVAGQEGGVVITTLSGQRKEMDLNFAKARKYMLSMDGKKVRIIHDDGVVNYFVVHASVDDKIVVANITPVNT